MRDIIAAIEDTHDDVVRCGLFERGTSPKFYGGARGNATQVFGYLLSISSAIDEVFYNSRGKSAETVAIATQLMERGVKVSDRGLKV